MILMAPHPWVSFSFFFFLFLSFLYFSFFFFLSFSFFFFLFLSFSFFFLLFLAFSLDWIGCVGAPLKSTRMNSSILLLLYLYITELQAQGIPRSTIDLEGSRPFPQ